MAALSKKVTLKQLPSELFSIYSKYHEVLLVSPTFEIPIRNMRMKSNVADIGGDLYYFGNTYGNINPYKNVKNMVDLVKFIVKIDETMSKLVKGHVTDITVLNVSRLMHDVPTAEKLLTSNEVVYPDYTVELVDTEYLDIEIDDDHATITTKDELIVEKVGSFDLKKLFKMEYLNSLYLVKMSHRRDLDLRGIMNLLPQLEASKQIDIIHMIDSHDSLTVCLHIPENMIPKVFGYKLKKRTTRVRIDDLTPVYISESVKG